MILIFMNYLTMSMTMRRYHLTFLKHTYLVSIYIRWYNSNNEKFPSNDFQFVFIWSFATSIFVVRSLFSWIFGSRFTAACSAVHKTDDKIQCLSSNHTGVKLEIATTCRQRHKSKLFLCISLQSKDRIQMRRIYYTVIFLWLSFK